MNIAVAVSGGTDSLYTLATLTKEFGSQNVFALHGLFKAKIANDPIPKLQEQCKKLNVPLHVVDLHKEFKSLVIHPFIQSYINGKTPNPCVYCNSKIKFGLLQEKAQSLGATNIATGHYVALIEHEYYGTSVKCGADVTKDQSYFLALTPNDQLKTAIFPLGTLYKSEVRQRLQSMGLDVPLPKESQEICFVPNDDYKKFILSNNDALSSSGPIIFYKTGKVLGTHNGLWRYTEGQRRGLGIAWSEPLYVIEKNTLTNTLIVGTEKELFVTTCTASHVNFLVKADLWPKKLFVRTRYRQKKIPADIQLTKTKTLTKMIINFHEPQHTAAPGQLAAIFDESGYVLAGGIIE